MKPPSPRTAILSDIHGNLSPLLSVLNDVRMQRCDRIVCLGDLVDGHDDATEVVRLIRERCDCAVRGNHDEFFPDPSLPQELRDYLSSLPELIVEGDVCFTHISPRENRRIIRGPIEAWNVFDEFPWRLIFIGHVHYPLIFGEKCKEPATSRVYPVRYNEPFSLDPKDRYVICPGSVSDGRDGIALPRYAIYDDAAAMLEIRKVG